MVFWKGAVAVLLVALALAQPFTVLAQIAAANSGT
jgi:hypothetical protein